MDLLKLNTDIFFTLSSFIGGGAFGGLLPDSRSEKPQQRAAGLCDGILNIQPLVKGRAIHDNDCCWRECWQQIVYRPAEKSICIDIVFEHSHCQQTCIDSCADNIDTASGVRHTPHDIARRWARTRGFVAYGEQTHFRQ